MQGCRKSLELGPRSWSSSRRDLGPSLGLLGVAPSSAVALGVPRGIFPTSPCALSSAAARWHSGCAAGLGWAEPLCSSRGGKELSVPCRVSAALGRAQSSRGVSSAGTG